MDRSEYKTNSGPNVLMTKFPSIRLRIPYYYEYSVPSFLRLTDN